MAKGRLGVIEGQKAVEAVEGIWKFDDDDWALIAMLQDPVFCAELLFEDPNNKDYSGCYHVRDYQYPLFRPRRNYNIKPCARDVGKALADDEVVLTPAGLIPITSVRPGDYVIGSSGDWTKVTGVFPQEGWRDIYEVTFGDGATVRCDGDHLWTVTCDTWQSRGTGERTLALRELASRKASFKVRLPSGPMRFASLGTPTPVDPWLLGALLGDGNLTRPTMVRFASVDDENIERVRAALPLDAELVHDGGCNYRVRSREYVLARPGTRSPGRAAHTLLRWLREEGLQGCASYEKTIPDRFLYESPGARLALLRGLLDTDGSVTEHGCVELSSASYQLALSVQWLVWSLGGRASLNQGPTPCRDRYRVVLRIPGVTPFLLTRKARLYEQRNASRQLDCDWRSIARIELIARGPCTCISVDATDGLFVAGTGLVLTHNTESIKARAVCHVFKRMGEDLLLTAPQMIHLDPVTQAVENRISSTRLTRDFLRKDTQRTGFTHKPFQADFVDGTRIIGRIPHIDGKGVKGMHEPDLLGDEMQDYPEAGWTELFPTVMKDHMDATGNFDFTMTFYGVHAAAGQGGTFGRLAKSPSYDITVITRLQTPWWSKQEKEATAAMYGGTNTPDYRRNVLGEPGQAFSQFFSTARLMACIDQDKESRYNTLVFKAQEFEAEEAEKMVPPDGDIGDLLDLPSNLGQQVYCGMDIGLVSDPTVIMVWALLPDTQKRTRLQLVRMIHLWRFTEKQIRQCTYRIARQYGLTLRAFGQDITGLGLPLYQAMESDEECPEHLKEVAHGYVFNAKVPVAVAKDYTSQQGDKLVDQYGHIVEIERDKWTGEERLVARMTMIEASTRYLRNFVDPTFLLLPFHDKLIADFQGETEQRVKAMAGVRKKPSAFHMLDAARCMAMGYKQGEMEEQVYQRPQQPVMDRAVYIHPALA